MNLLICQFYWQGILDFNNHQQMLTDSSADFKIVLANSQQLICYQSHAARKIIYRQFESVSQNKLDKIWKLTNILHPNLLKLFKIQKQTKNNNSSNQQCYNQFGIGLHLQFYTGSLQKYLGERNFDFDQQEIVNTFLPIQQIVNFLISKQWNFTGISMKNIVITEEMEIKYIDDCILEPNNDQNISKTTQQIYEQISDMLFKILVPEQQKLKSRKSKVNNVRKKCKKQTFDFFQSIYNRSLVNVCDKRKTKKISKRSMQKISKKCEEGEKNEKRAHYVVEGKQNQMQIKN